MKNKQKYYLKNREKLLNYQKEKYAKEHKRKYKRYYLVIAPDGTEYQFERTKDLSKFFGCSADHIERLHGKFGYKVQKVY